MVDLPVPGESDDMNERPELPREMIEPLEVCRAGGEAASDSASRRLAAFLAVQPEWAELHTRREQLDEVLGRAIRDVPVPEGLEERILDRLRAAASEQVGGVAMESAPTLGDERVAAPAAVGEVVKHRGTRRRLLLASAAMVAASVLVVVIFHFWTPGGLTAAEVCDEALRRFAPASEDGHEPLSDDVLRRFPVASDVVLPPGTRWRKLDGFLGHESVAYEMTGWRGNRATLFVVSCPRAIPDLVNRVPRRSTPATGGRAVGVWQVAGRVYVLVVEGNDRDYNALLRPRPALT
ncbi:MAG TPA: hypothetical protein DD670_16895 [Planctomycetaceae bacterium]|nr:hypothetical protein [Planctomycetaceae bacterium]